VRFTRPALTTVLAVARMLGVVAQERCSNLQGGRLDSHRPGVSAAQRRQVCVRRRQV